MKEPPIPYTRSRDKVLDPQGRQVACAYGRTNADRFCSELNDLLSQIKELQKTVDDPMQLTTNCTRCGAPGVLDLAKGLRPYCLCCEEKPQPKPIGKCPQCNSPTYSTEGFCGVCEPHKS